MWSCDLEPLLVWLLQPSQPSPSPSFLGIHPRSSFVRILCRWIWAIGLGSAEALQLRNFSADHLRQDDPPSVFGVHVHPHYGQVAYLVDSIPWSLACASSFKGCADVCWRCRTGVNGSLSNRCRNTELVGECLSFQA